MVSAGGGACADEFEGGLGAKCDRGKCVWVSGGGK